MFNLILDILIYSFTPFKSFFFLLNINDKDFLTNITVGLIIDIFIVHTFGITSSFIIIFYYLHKKININFYNFINYYAFNITMILLYYLITNIIYKIDIKAMISIIIINSIYIFISYKKDRENIKLFG